MSIDEKIKLIALCGVAKVLKAEQSTIYNKCYEQGITVVFTYYNGVFYALKKWYTKNGDVYKFYTIKKLIY